MVDSLNMIGCKIQPKLVPAMNYYFNHATKLTANQAECLWNAYESEFELICDILSGSHHDYIFSQRDFRAFIIHLVLSEKWNENDLRSFISGLKNKPTRETSHEMTGYYFRMWYDIFNNITSIIFHNKLQKKRLSYRDTRDTFKPVI